MKLLRGLALALATCVVAGCASFVAHNDYMTGESQAPPISVYPGTIMDCGGIVVGATAPFVAPFHEDIAVWQVVFVPLCLIDLPFSFVLDTLYLPFDIIGSVEDRPYKAAEKDPFWDEAFRAGAVDADVARHHFTQYDLSKIDGLLRTHSDGSASNVVCVIFDLAITNDASRSLVGALCIQTGLAHRQYYRLSETADTDAYENERRSMRASLARIPSLPRDLLLNFAASSDPEVAIGAFHNPTLPLQVATNMLNQFAYSNSQQLQDVVVHHPTAPPDLLRRLATTQGEWGLRKVLVARNPNCPADLLELFASDEDRWLRTAVAEHPMTSSDTLEMLASDADPLVRAAVGKHPSTPDSAWEKLCADSDYHVRTAAIGQKVGRARRQPIAVPSPSPPALPQSHEPEPEPCTVSTNISEDSVVTQVDTNRSHVTRSPELMDGLVLHYSFDTNEVGTVSDASGHGRTAHSSGVAWIEDGPRGGAVRFGSIRSTIWADDKGLPSGDAPRSIAMWIRLDEERSSDLTSMLSYGQNQTGQRCALDVDWQERKIRVSFSPRAHSILARRQLPEAGSWVHVVYTYSQHSGHHLYIDGLLEDGAIENEWIRIETTLSGFLLLGGHPDTPGPNGRCLDEVMIFNRALTDTEALALFRRGGETAVP